MRLSDDLRRLARSYRSGRSLALLFDFDGTLSPIVTHPDLAVCTPGALEELAALSQLPRVVVGVISGRTLTDLKTKINFPGLVCAGTCGLELEIPGGCALLGEAERRIPVVRAALEKMQPLVASYGGAWVELKPLAFTVHYRHVERHKVPLLRQCLDVALKGFDGLLTSIDGSKATEVLPALGWSKGDALEAILQRDSSNPLPFYAGNDANDREALRVASERGGVGIGIGPTAPSVAMHRLESPEELVEQLRRLRGLLEDGQGFSAI